MPIEYNEYDYKLFDTEEISIENGELNIKLYGKDNSFGTFKYFGNDLLLSSVEAFYRGAGSQEGIKYDFLKGEQTTTEIDLISDVENPKVTENKNSIDKEKHYFENISIIDFLTIKNIRKMKILCLNILFSAQSVVILLLRRTQWKGKCNYFKN